MGGATDWFQVVTQGGSVAVLAVASYGFFRGWWVPGWVYRSVKRERDEFLEMALRGSGQSERALTLARRATTLIEEES